ncbi:MAG: DNA polymerase III subunit gamma/tau [Bdellovibrionota bacterium]|nr:DNA polymerase III subunit gamma/tau [Bdellovibrionota bacterium]
MSYQVIARKWRPQSFQELVGQESIAQTILNALKADRLPHALLFTGTRGVGKTSSARILAKSLRCPNAIEFRPCNKCSECEEISSGSSVNVIEIDGASNNGVDAIRELRDSVGYMPSSGKHKIYIIDEVHMLSTSAFNALLKTLEEPPEHVTFILATTEVQKIPVTVLSRCQRFDFRRISTQKIADHLSHICNQENVAYENEAIWLVARQADGSMRDALSLLDQVISFCDKDLKYTKLVEVLGLTDRQLILDGLQILANRDQEAMLGLLERIHQGGTDAKNYMDELIEEIRNLLLVKVSGNNNIESLLDLPQSEIQILQKLANEYSAEEVHMLFDMALKAGNDLPKAHNPIMVLEMAMLRMVSAPYIKNLVAGNYSDSQVEKKKPSQLAPNTSSSSSNSPNTTIVRSTAANQSENTSTASVTSNTNGRNISAGKNPPKNQNLAQKTSQNSDQNSMLSGSPNAMESLHYLNDLDLSENWMRLVQHSQKHTPILAAQLEHCIAISFDDGHLKLGIRKQQEFLMAQLSEESKKLKIQQVILKSGWAEKVEKIEFLPIDDKLHAGMSSPAEIIKQKKQDAKEALQKQIQENPLVGKALETFNAKIIAIKETK